MKRSINQVATAKLNVCLSIKSFKIQEAKTDGRRNRDSLTKFEDFNTLLQ